MSLLKQLLALFFPEKCLLCKNSVDILCASCADALTPYRNNNPELPNFVRPVLSYKDSKVKELIWAFKYSNRKHLAPILASALQDTLLATVSELIEIRGVRSILLIPIPLHPKRLRERGYNQSELLVQALAQLDVTGIISAEVSALTRKKFSAPNAKSHSKRERRENTIGSFEVTYPDKVLDQYIILVDDVVTTGTTLSEARKVLFEAGARHVEAITIAH